MQQNSKNNIEDIYELTPMQQGMLYHTFYKEGSDVYIEQFCFDIEGDLKKDLFRKSWEKVTGRHGVLRTSFQWKGISKPVQIVNKTAELPWTEFDWSGLSTDQQEIDFKNFLEKDRASVFSMDKAPLMRCALIKTGDKSYKFVWSFHHIILDGWSYPVIQKEVFAIYEALSESREINLPLPLPYKQYILWLNGKNKSTSENFWKKELAGFSTATPMIEGGKIRQSGNEDTEEQTLKLSAELTSGLQSFARSNQLTLNTIIQGVWGIILSDYTGENDVLFGSTVSGRTSSIKGIESMVGIFINTIPTRMKVNKENEIIPWLKKLQEAHILRDEYFYTSLVDIQEWSGLPKGTQLFDNILVFENYPLDRASLTGSSGIKVLNVKAIEKTSFPLTILVSPGEALSITFLYETAKIEKETIAQILLSFKMLLESISKNTFNKISELSLLSKNEENKILYEWNNTKHDFPKDKSVPELFVEAAEKYRDKTAVEFNNGSLTYTQLNERANRLAHYLSKLGVGPDVKVGISIERSAEMAIGMLAILKAGGAYVPLDPSNPGDRLSYMIEDSGIPVLLTQSKLKEKFQNVKIRTVLIDSEEAVINKESKSNPLLKDHSSNLAYVIYTSGSTGKPKGVLMKHEALTNLLYWQLNGEKFGQEYRVLQFTTLSFDVSFQEIFSTWLSGGTLVMMTEQDRQDLPVIMKTIIEKRIQRLFLPFIALQELAELFPASGITSDLREVITAGEQLQCTPAIVNLFKQLRDFTFSNHYGPTEAHVVTSYTLSNDPDSWVKLPPIGKPVFNVQMHILNSYLKPVPVGVSGDLYIGGVCLARGYHNNEELTKEKFINNPFYEKEKELSRYLYKTGDLARYLPDGNIEYLGRTDSQIKMRGYRIEPGEIESVLAEYSGMKSTAVVVKEFVNGDKRLIAYYVTSEITAPQSGELKDYMKTKLPEYMIPSHYIRLDEMPLTATGKINHRELPSPDFIRTNESSNYEEPKDSLELQLTKIWEKVLGISQVGIKDNFFNLGGNSLLALRLFGYIEKLSGRKLALSILFDSPTIEELALILKNEGWTPPWKSLVPVKPGGSKLPFFCVPPAGGTALHFQNLVKYISDDQPMYVLESIGLDGQEPPHTNLEEMAAHYIKEIQSLQPDGPYLLGGRCFGGRVVFEMAQQFVKLGQKVALLAIFDTWPPFIEPPVDHIPLERDLKHFLSRSFHHLMTGELFTVARNYTVNTFIKTKWKVKNKIEYAFSSSKKRLYKDLMLIHFKAQDKYIAKKYPGKITLIECASFKSDYREGWRNLAGAGLETHTVPNTTHKTIVKEPYIKLFAEKMNLVLEKTHGELKGKINNNDTMKSVSKNVSKVNIHA